MSNHKNLIFFNKEGDYLNFNHNETNDMFEGDILFHENSNDTYKTYGVYMLEKIPSFEFEHPEMITKKFQLFNEYGIDFYSSKYSLEQITNIQPVNNDPQFFSKWIFGSNFEMKFPIGTLISFDSTLLEFSNSNKTYTVVSSKKNAIMIISQIDNSTFELNYQSLYNDPSTYINKTISGVNAIGICDYIDLNTYTDNLSDWNEPEFYSNLFNGKKLNIINTQFNNNVVTINNFDLFDINHFSYNLESSLLPSGSDLIIEVITKTDLPKIYDGYINIDNISNIQINPNYYPDILKPDMEFKIIGTNLNDIFLTVDYIPNWDNIYNTTYFTNIDSQVLYNNKIYECILSYTHSFGTQSTAYITPEDTTYWSPLPTHIKVTQSTNTENIYNGQLYLTTNKYYFTQEWKTSEIVTLAAAAERYKDDLSIFDIDLYYDNDINILNSDLKYASNYVITNFYFETPSPTYSIGSILSKTEKIIGVEEELHYELNYDISENFSTNIIFTDIDEYGIKIIINKMVYDEEVSWVYNGTAIDMPRTIDKTLKNWLSRYYITLYSLGINAELQYIGTYISPFNNAIKITTEYPNVPIEINEVLVGTTANFYIEHSSVLFTEIGPYLNININNTDYGVTSSYYVGTNTTDINTTLSKWVTTHSERLLEYDILVNNINSLLKFDFINLDSRLEYTISTNLLNLPGLDGYKIINKLNGNHGALIASNEVVLPGLGNSPNNLLPGQTSSVNILDAFTEQGFATGMVFSINNTPWTWVNQEYNIQYIDEGCLNLSYEGPFWGSTNSICTTSPFTIISYNMGFEVAGCTGSTISGEFNSEMFNNSFNISSVNSSYTTNNYNLSYYDGSDNFIDIKYIQLSNTIYALGDGLLAIDAYSSYYITTIDLPNIDQSIKIEFNTINNYIYCLSTNYLYIIDPLTNTLISDILLSGTAYDIAINSINGDAYITYEDMTQVDVISFDDFSTINIILIPSSTIRNGKIIFNVYNELIYLTTDNDIIVTINNDRSIETLISITNLKYTFIFYEEINNSILVYNTTQMLKIDSSNNITVISLLSGTFNDIILNNFTSNLNISDSSTKISTLEIDSEDVTQSSINNFGYLVMNQFDGNIYLSSQYGINPKSIATINSQNNIIHTTHLNSKSTKLIYNPSRKSIWSIQPDINSIVEIKVTVVVTATSDDMNYTEVGENLYGTLAANYEVRNNLWLKACEYIRQPRENYEGDIAVKYYWRWLTDDKPEFFLYDFSGEQLTTTGSYSYKGVKPLTNIVLNSKPNRDINKVYYPEYQQTIFPQIEYTLPYLDDVDDISSNVEPLQLFIGFKSSEEGAFTSTLQLFKKEEIQFNIDSNILTNITLETIDDKNDRYALIKLNENSPEVFTGRGLKAEQLIVIYLKDITNEQNQYTSNNTSSIFKIRNIYSKQLILDFISSTDSIINEQTTINDYPKAGNITYLRFTLKVSDKQIGNFTTYGQTEDEDERFKIELGNIGKLINPDEVFIFKEYDISEGGIDWIILNRKRKEMMMMKHLIYPYIGAYKSIINAINYFGYNELQLNEYYRNIDSSSENFYKLFKVEIPDIFDNSVEGWTENDFIANTYPNDKFEDTNLFNLTYFITDKEGNNVLNYSLDEIIIKLQGLKYWLKRNIIPLTHKILDITGQSYVNSSNYIQHTLHDVKYFNIIQNMTPISFKLNEAYLSPINSGSTVYSAAIEFYSIIPGLGTEDYLIDKPKPYNNVELTTPDSFDIKIRTYKTYKEWEPFTYYSVGDKIKYYDKLYESVINLNRINNPLKYKDSQVWSANVEYTTTSLAEYERDYYVFKGISATQSSVSPNIDTLNWLKVTEWKQINYSPVQTIKEYRNGDNLNPYIFTLDTNIDPFVTIEVTSDNGYGEIYTDKKNYELRSSNDLGIMSLEEVTGLPKLSTSL